MVLCISDHNISLPNKGVMMTDAQKQRPQDFFVLYILTCNLKMSKQIGTANALLPGF